MKLNSQLAQYQRIKLKKIKKIKKKRKIKLANSVNMPMNFLKFNNIFYFRNYFFNYMIKRKINDHIIEFN
jgi:hypothetical protein